MSTALQADFLLHEPDEFATGVDMPEGNSHDELQELKALILANSKPKLPAWVTASLAGICVALLTAIGTGLITYGSMQTRLTMLENRTQSIDRLNSVEAKVDALTGTVTRMEARFNEVMDNQAKRDR